MSEVVGRFTLNGTKRQNDVIRAMAELATMKYGDRLAANVQVWFMPAAEMPKRADGGPSVGFTPSWTKILLWQAVRRYPCVEVFAHEVGHALPMSKVQKQEVIALAVPTGGKWNAPGYADDVRESGAVAQSRAVLGVVNPPYQRFYTHKLNAADDAVLAQIYLRPAVTPEPDPKPPQPTPPEPVDLQKQIDALEAENGALKASLNEVAADNLAVATKAREAGKAEI